MYLLAIGAGAANPVQAGANAQLRKSVEHAIFSATVVYLSGLIGVLIVQLLAREGWPDSGKLLRAPWWAWMGGLLSIASTLAGITMAQRMGSGIFTGLSVSASLIMSVVLDNFGWIGFKAHHASWPRIAGCGLMVCGLWLIAKF